NTPMPPVPLSSPRMAGRKVASVASASEKMLKPLLPALLPLLEGRDEEPPPTDLVKMQFSMVKKFRPSPPPKACADEKLAKHPHGAPLPMARMGASDQPPRM